MSVIYVNQTTRTMTQGPVELYEVVTKDNRMLCTCKRLKLFGKVTNKRKAIVLRTNAMDN